MGDQATRSASPWHGLFRGALGRLTIGLLLVESASAIQIFTTATVLPEVTNRLNGRPLYGVTLAAATLSALVMIPLTAPLVDQFGRRRVLIAAALAYVVGGVISATAPEMSVFIAGRGVQGLAGGALSIFGLSAVAGAYPDEMKPRLFSLISLMWVLPALVGPPYAALVTGLAGWRLALALPLPLIGIGALLVGRARQLASVSPSEREPMPLVATTLLVAGISLVLLGTSLASGAGMVLAVAGLLITIVSAHQLLPVGTFIAAPGAPAAAACMFLICFAYFGTDGLMPLYLTAGLGRSR